MVSHSWSSATSHFHQNFLSVPATTLSGVTSPFLVGCHWAAMSGNFPARLLVTDNCRPEQHGQPTPLLVRLFATASHSWSSATSHFHQNLLFDPATTSAAVRSPFLVRCHCAATSGNRVSKLLVTDTFLPAQHGHPRPPLVRLLTTVCHSWSSATSHFHQVFRCEPKTTSAGVRSPFLVGCHWSAMSGKFPARLLVTDTCRPEQLGQPVSALVRLAGVVCHSWSSATSHFHQAFFLEPPAATSAGVTSPFLVGCHWSATSGNNSSRDPRAGRAIDSAFHPVTAGRINQRSVDVFGGRHMGYAVVTRCLWRGFRLVSTWPLRISSPPHTPHGSRFSNASSRHNSRMGHSAQMLLAWAIARGASE